MLPRKEETDQDFGNGGPIHKPLSSLFKPRESIRGVF